MDRQAGVAHLVLIAAAAIAAVLTMTVLLERSSRRNVVEAHFWFDGVTFELSGWESAVGGPLTRAETERIQAVAFTELKQAFDGLRVRFLDTPGGTYRIRVVQEFPARRGPANPAGMARPMGPLGGEAAVNFRGIVGLAVHHAPPGADRTAIVDGIGRGLGRTAAHELAHLILFGERVPGSADARSYEYESPDRPEQYYGSLHWDTAWPLLVSRLGASGASGAPPIVDAQ